MTKKEKKAVKAAKWLQKWCGSTICRKCVFFEETKDGMICKLEKTAPCCWELPKKEET